MRTVKGGDGAFSALRLSSSSTPVTATGSCPLLRALTATAARTRAASRSKAHRAAITKHGWVAGLHRESLDPRQVHD